MGTAVSFKRAAAIAAVAVIAVGAVDCVMAQGANAKPSISTFADKRDGKTYKKVAIGKQVWMAENLNYDVPDVDSDVCYDNSPDSCAKYGRLYDWETAKKACPAGFHLSTNEEWATLIDYVGGKKTAGTKLKSGWRFGKSGTDEYGFSALPGGCRLASGQFHYIGSYGNWWSADVSESRASEADSWFMPSSLEIVAKSDDSEKAMKYSVRCVQD